MLASLTSETPPGYTPPAYLLPDQLPPDYTPPIYVLPGERPPSYTPPAYVLPEGGYSVLNPTYYVGGSGDVYQSRGTPVRPGGDFIGQPASGGSGVCLSPDGGFAMCAGGGGSIVPGTNMPTVLSTTGGSAAGSGSTSAQDTGGIAETVSSVPGWAWGIAALGLLVLLKR